MRPAAELCYEPAMRGRTERTPKRERQFLDALAEGLSVTGAAARVKLGRSTVYEWRDTDSDFATAWDKAIEAGTDILEDEARRRAYERVEEPVHYQGERVDTIRRYSDTLLIFMLKGRRPGKFRDNAAVEVTGTDGGPLTLEALVLATVARREAEAAKAAETATPENG